MAIKIKSLEANSLDKTSLDNGYLYKDLALDLNPAYSYNSQLNRKEFLKDVQASYDVQAIKNSIVNAFLTAPGDKILNPTYGIDLRRFLFEPIDDFTTEIIKDDIQTNLPLMEPRITIDNIYIYPDEEENQYDIELQINVPSLGVYGLNIKSRLNSSGYTVL
jgi:phage baseplate assembly protein W